LRVRSWTNYAIMLPWNASHSRRSPKSPHVAHSECIASPKCAYLKLWLQIRNVPCSSSCRGTSQPPVTIECPSFTNRTRTSPCQQFRSSNINKRTHPTARVLQMAENPFSIPAIRSRTSLSSQELCQRLTSLDGLSLWSRPSDSIRLCFLPVSC
jgi:hypothetical protein